MAAYVLDSAVPSHEEDGLALPVMVVKGDHLHGDEVAEVYESAGQGLLDLEVAGDAQGDFSEEPVLVDDHGDPVREILPNRVDMPNIAGVFC